MAQLDQKAISEMQKDGVGMGYFHEDKQKFLICGGCCQPFGLQMLPMLLNCGHFICSACYNNFKNICIYCNGAQSVRIANYRKMFDYISSTAKAINTSQNNDKYSFSIKLNDYQAYTFNQIPGNMTFKTLFWKIEQFQSFQSQMKNKIRIFINSVGSIYEQIADMEIQKYNAYIQMKNRPNGALVSNGTRSNMITFHNRYLGGKSYQ